MLHLHIHSHLPEHYIIKILTRLLNDDDDENHDDDNNNNNNNNRQTFNNLSPVNICSTITIVPQKLKAIQLKWTYNNFQKLTVLPLKTVTK